MARKIGGLREAILVAMEGSLGRERHARPEPDSDSTQLESLLHVVSGEVAEQRTKLDHDFRTFGETPDAVLDALFQQAASWGRTASEGEISSLQLSEWIHDIVRRSIQTPIDDLREAGNRALTSLNKIAKDMGRSDAASEEEFELLLRDLPRFELAALPEAISIGHWRFLGEGVLRWRIRSSLRQSIGAHLKDEQHLYGMALSQWSEQVVRKVEALVNPYADAYRVQLHRMSGTSTKAANLEQLEADLELLQQWGTETAGKA